jgi:hypothetical protein
MKKLILTLILLSLIGLINATDLVKQNNCISINKICDNCTYMNLSSYTNPNGTIYFINTGMTENIKSIFNYTFCNTSMLGIYDIKYCGNPDGLFLCNNYNIKVTNTGYDTELPQVFIIFFIIGIILIIALLLFIFGMNVETVSVKIFCLSLTALLMIFLVGYISGIANVTIGEFSSITDGFTPLYILFISLLSVGAIGLILYLIAFSLDAFRKKRGLKL